MHRILNYKQILAILIGLFISIGYINLQFGAKRTNFEDANNMGANTTSLMASVGQHRIHCADSRDVASCINGIRISKPKNVALWLGNSQLHAVNQLKENQLNAPPIAFTELIKSDIYLLALSQPNANLQEHHLAYLHLNKKFKINYLILPLVFDDLREDGIRSEILQLSNDHSQNEDLQNSRKLGTNNEFSEQGLRPKTQDLSEEILDNFFKEHFIFWRSRDEARGSIFKNMYLIRNSVFGITPSTKRKLIKAHYQQNMAALAETLKLAREQDTKVILYIAPIRNDVEIPYLSSEYETFKNESKNLGERYEAIFLNLENLVPAEFWGTKDSTNLNKETEIDFMHFQSKGHELLAKKIVENIQKTHK